jgi:hypothetical protein
MRNKSLAVLKRECFESQQEKDRRRRGLNYLLSKLSYQKDRVRIKINKSLIQEIAVTISSF